MKENETIKGKIIDNPLKKIKIGDKIDFKFGRINHNYHAKPTWNEIWHQYNGVLLAIQFRNHSKNTFGIEGSAVMVAPGVALSAKHVFERHIDEFNSWNESALAIGLHKEGLQIWHLTKLKFVTNSDIAILTLELASELPEDKSFNHAEISTRLPKLDEELLITGYRTWNSNPTSIKINSNELMKSVGNVYAINGTVTNRYPSGRDNHMLSWPSLEVNCPSIGGMSGGPVFDTNGLLIGLLCSSFESGPSYISLIWPSLVTIFDGGWPTSTYESLKTYQGKHTLLDLANRGLCYIDKPTAITTTTYIKEKKKTMTYYPWE
jgi:hypothetical protein